MDVLLEMYNLNLMVLGVNLESQPSSISLWEINMYVCLFICIYECIYVCMYVYLNMCVCVHTHIYLFLYMCTPNSNVIANFPNKELSKQQWFWKESSWAQIWQFLDPCDSNLVTW